MYLHNVLSAYFSLALNAVSMTLEKLKKHISKYSQFIR